MRRRSSPSASLPLLCPLLAPIPAPLLRPHRRCRSCTTQEDFPGLLVIRCRHDRRKCRRRPLLDRSTTFVSTERFFVRRSSVFCFSLTSSSIDPFLSTVLFLSLRFVFPPPPFPCPLARPLASCPFSPPSTDVRPAQARRRGRSQGAQDQPPALRCLLRRCEGGPVRAARARQPQVDRRQLRNPRAERGERSVERAK